MRRELFARNKYLQDCIDRLDNRIDRVDSELDRLDNRIDRVDSELAHLDSRIDRIEARLEKIAVKLDERKEVKSPFDFLSIAVTVSTAMVAVAVIYSLLR